MKYKLFAVSVFIGLLSVSCQEKKSVKNESNSNKKTIRIVSLNGALSEIIYALGYESNLVATDVTSNYPESIHKLPKVGHNRSIQAEGILAQNPDVVVGIQKELNPKVIKQIKASGIKKFVLEVVTDEPLYINERLDEYKKNSFA